eukprot:TRINITY_DN3299_c0_g1_i1.p1 TRINITY_DN3299_c0_g1~~TRINITY_DN3299_c0_g1_i1.p1  ORF type:complete len:124 (+),score=22.67 TRINITY_DN3299_c0_g1_i1:222-593(+)
MSELDKWFHSEQYMNLHPIERAALAHYQLVWLHPYVDGNGRTSRLLMNMILMHAGFPEVIIEVDDRLRYYETLQDAHPTHGGDTTPFILFIAQALENDTTHRNTTSFRHSCPNSTSGFTANSI